MLKVAQLIRMEPPSDVDSKLGVQKPLKKLGRKKSRKPCKNCNTLDTPEWRKGPEGPATLCNACGLRYAKQVRDAAKAARERQALDLAWQQTLSNPVPALGADQLQALQSLVQQMAPIPSPNTPGQQAPPPGQLPVMTPQHWQQLQMRQFQQMQYQTFLQTQQLAQYQQQFRPVQPDYLPPLQLHPNPNPLAQLTPQPQPQPQPLPQFHQQFHQPTYQPIQIPDYHQAAAAPFLQYQLPQFGQQTFGGKDERPSELEVETPGKAEQSPDDSE